jgi:hydrogenase maturation protease
MAKDLVIGYGNADRQDDGVAWHVLASLARSLGRSVPLEAGDEFTPSSGEPELLFVPQLTPEMAEDIAAYQRVCFIDAHTGEIDQEVRLLEIRPDFQAAPFTHHMTPQTLLLVAQKLYTVQIQGWLLSVHGYEFGFARDLSPQTEVLVPRAVDYLRNWLDHPE